MNKILIGAAILLVASMYMTSDTEQRYYVPGTGYVPESQLPSLGYTNIGGKWYSQSQIDAAAAQAGVGAGNVQQGSTAWNAILQILKASIPLATTIIQNTGNTGNNSGGMAGFGINDCHEAGYWTRLGSRQHARELANCRWHK